MPTENERIKELETKVALYESPGGAALFYALNRKMNEIASLLNAVNLKTIDMATKADASFERVFKLLEKSESISTAAKALGDFSGVTGDEAKDVQNPKYRITTPESISDVLGNSAGQHS